MERTETRELLLRLSRATGVSGAEEGPPSAPGGARR